MNFIEKHFEKLIESCRAKNSLIKNFLNQFSDLIFLTSFSAETSKFYSQIVKLFEIFIEPDTDEESESESDLDLMVLVVELYNWFESGIEFFEWDSSELEICLKLIYKFLITRKSSNPDFFLDFYLKTFDKYASISFLRAVSFGKFIKINYDPKRPSHELLKALRKLSWSNDSLKLKNFLKNFLSLEVRSSFLRKLSFNHKKEIDYEIPSDIFIFFDENKSINRNLFEGVYESLLENAVLIYPLKVEISSSGIFQDIIRNNSGYVLNLGVTLNKFWTILALHEYNFFRLNEKFDNENNNEFVFIPNPWTHPNILFVAGCVMTLAYLHGIKLTSWSLKYSLFASIFNLNLKPIDSDFNLFDENEDNSLAFYSLNDFIGSFYSDAVNFTFEYASESGLEELLLINESLKSKTTKILFKLQKKFTSKFSDGTSDLDCEISDLWIGNKFLKLENFSNLSSESDLSENQQDLSLPVFEEYSDRESVEIRDMEEEFEIEAAKAEVNEYAETEASTIAKAEEQINVFESSSSLTEEIFDKNVEVVRLQLYSMFLGLQPLTRFLKTKEAYEAIFIS